MSRFLLLNFKDFSLNQDITQTIQSHALACMCCLQKDVPFIYSSSCKHANFLENFTKFELEQSRKVVCCECHAMLKRIELFKQQVEKSLKILCGQTSNDGETLNVKLRKEQSVNIYLPPVKYSKCDEIITYNEKQAKDKQVHVVLTEGIIKAETMETIDSDNNSLITDPLLIPETQEQNGDMKKNKVRVVKLTKEELMRERLKEAQSKEYLEYPYHCENCIIGFNYEDNFKDHMRRKHGPKSGSVLCKICLTVLYPPGCLNAHYFRHFTRYDCDACGKRYATFDEALHHYNNTHEISQTMLNCNDCSFSTENNNKMKYHKYRHHKKHLCKECGIALAPTSLRKHMRIFHKKSHTCVHCGATIDSARAYSTHVRTHGTNATQT